MQATTPANITFRETLELLRDFPGGRLLLQSGFDQFTPSSLLYAFSKAPMPLPVKHNEDAAGVAELSLDNQATLTLEGGDWRDGQTVGSLDIFYMVALVGPSGAIDFAASSAGTAARAKLGYSVVYKAKR